MYELRQSPFGEFTRYDLQHSKTGNGFSIVPAFGANVLNIQFGGQNILDGYDSPEALTEGKWGKSSILFPFPNRLAKGTYSWLGKKYQFPINHPATGNAIHGFVREVAFDVEYCFLTKDGASIRCFYEYAGQREYYPFPFLLEIECTISNDGRFRLAVAVENTGGSPMPMGFGWHPYFKLATTADTHALKLPPCTKVEIDNAMIPTGKQLPYAAFQTQQEISGTVLDNCFQHEQTSGSPKMLLTGGRRSLSVKASAKQFPYFQVFTPPHRESVALEPMSCNVDAFNNKQGLIALESGKSWKAGMELRFA